MDSKILKALGIDPALIFIFLLILIVILFVLYVNGTMKYNRLKMTQLHERLCVVKMEKLWKKVLCRDSRM